MFRLGANTSRFFHGPFDCPMALLLALIKQKASFHGLQESDLDGRRIPDEGFREMDMVIRMEYVVLSCGN
jgi:hypothetical protein